MRDPTWNNLVAGSIAILVVVAGAVVIGMAPASPRAAPAVHYVNLTIEYSPSTGDSWYTSGNISVPAFTPIIFTITNYDPVADPLLVSHDNQVIGTAGGREAIRVGSSGPESQVRSFSSNDVSHTFTMLDIQYNLNIPIPPAPNGHAPVVVTFQAVFDSVGTFQWGCMCRCGPMTDPGMMYGNVTVA